MGTFALYPPGRRTIVIAVVAAILGFAGALAITAPPGPGLDDDAKDYLGAAISLAHGKGLRVPTAWWDRPQPNEPLGHFPPGYPAVLSVPVRLGARPIAAARFTQAVAAGVSTGGVALLAGAAGPGAAALAAGLLLVTPNIALDHGRVLSEPLFLALFTVTLLLLVMRPDRPLLAGVAGALTSLVRYAGVGLVGGATLLALLAGGGRVTDRVRRALPVFLPAFLTLGLWALVIRRERAHVRDIEWHGTILPALALGWTTVRDWMAPGLPEGWAVVAAVLALVALAGLALLVRAAYRAGDANVRRLVATTLTVAASYFLFLCASRLLADPWLPFDERIFAPFFVLAPPLAAAGLVLGWKRWSPPWRRAAAALTICWAAASLRLTALTAYDFLADGWGYADVDFRSGGTVQWLDTPAADRPLFSNNPAAIWFADGKSAWFLPAASDPDTAIRAFGDTLRARRGLVVGFTDGDESIIAPDSLAARLGLVLMARFDDGAVWKPAPSAGHDRLAAPRRAP